MHPTFVFIAEVYWDMGWDLQQLGFDFTYDKVRINCGRIHGDFKSGFAGVVATCLNCGHIEL